MLIKFFLTALALLFTPFNLFPPLIVFSFYYNNRIKALWISAGAGFLFDCLAFSQPFGLYIFAYSCSTYMLYDFKRHFFVDSLSTFPIMGALYTLVLNGTLLLFSYIIGIAPFFTFRLFLDLFLYAPCLSAIFAFIGYTMPIMKWGEPRTAGDKYFI